MEGEAKTESFRVVGIVGGVGSGKSAVANWVGQQIPVTVIDADRVGHYVLTLEQVKTRLVEIFGRQILNPQGEIVRSQLGSLVWGNSPEQLQARQALEAIVHPEIRQQILAQIEHARQIGQWGILLDAAVMLESGWSQICDKIVFVDTREDVRRERVINLRGWSEEQWREREKSQFSVQEKQKRSDFTVDNSATLEQSGTQLLEYLQREFGWSKGHPDL